MTTTTIQTIGKADGWTSFSVNPVAISIKSNSIHTWHIAIAAAEPAANFEGEKWLDGFTVWNGSGITGTVWVRTTGPTATFAVTE